jgi:two-component system, OmpR family, response regulator RegX3
MTITDPGPQPVVLIVEDEESFVDAVTIGLEREGFKVRSASNGTDGLALFRKIKPDLVLLDVMMPGMTGIDVCRAIRADGDSTPIIMVTARTEELDVVLGLEFGADDYVTKPYRLRELVARIRAVLRRNSVAAGGGPRELPLKEVGDVRLDPERHEVRVRGDVVPLPRKEFELLELLMDRAGRVVSRDFAIEQVWGDDYVGDTKTLDVHINRLRGRLEEDASRPTRIVTVRGVGYRFELPR